MTMAGVAAGQVTVVNGGEGDPFTDPNATQVNQPGVTQPNNVNPVQQNGQQESTAVAPAVAASATTAAAKTYTEEEVAARIAAANSGRDRRMSTLEKQLADNQAALDKVKEENLAAVRAAQAQGLSDADKKRMQEIWDIEDAKSAIDKQKTELTSFYLSVEGLRLLNKYGEQGITEDDITSFSGDPTQLEAHIKALAFDRLTADPKAAAAAAANGKTVPAGAAATQDVGSTGVSAEGPKMLTTQGVDSMAANIKAMFNDNGPVVPWSI